MPSTLLKCFVGREQQLERLHQTMNQSKEQGEIMCIVGPDGIGKTTLLEKFTSELEEDVEVVWACCLSPVHTPFHVTAMIRAALNMDPGLRWDTPRLLRGVAIHLGLEGRHHPNEEDMMLEVRWDLRQLLRSLEGRRMLIVIEDVDGIVDGDALIDAFSELQEEIPPGVMVVLSGREGFDGMECIGLDDFTREEMETFVGRRSCAVPYAILDALDEVTGGHPLRFAVLGRSGYISPEFMRRFGDDLADYADLSLERLAPHEVDFLVGVSGLLSMNDRLCSYVRAIPQDECSRVMEYLWEEGYLWRSRLGSRQTYGIVRWMRDHLKQMNPEDVERQHRLACEHYMGKMCEAIAQEKVSSYKSAMGVVHFVYHFESIYKGDEPRCEDLQELVKSAPVEEEKRAHVLWALGGVYEALGHRRVAKEIRGE